MLNVCQKPTTQEVGLFATPSTLKIPPFSFTIIYSLLILFFTGCSGISYDETHGKPVSPQLFSDNYRDLAAVRKALYLQYNEWKGTPYALGGLSMKGIDCSGFVHLTYRTRFGIHLPRTTNHLQGLGFKIERNQLRPGDLVFFKTGFFSRHVGIFLEKHLFLHASTSQGVILSDLREDYWQKNYWKAVRIPTN